MIIADTNVFIYSIDSADIQKQAIARLVVIKLRRMRGPLALQVVGEFQNVASRKLKAERAATARYALELFMQDGATLLGLEIVNPFAANGVSRRAAELLGLA